MAIMTIGIDLAKNVFGVPGIDGLRWKRAGYDIRTVQELSAHSDVSTSMIYTHVLNRGGRGVASPLDRLG